MTLSFETCLFGCNLTSGACETPSANELLIDRLRPEPVFVPWPSPLIPVCWQAPSSDSESKTIRAAVRDSVATSWGRFSAIDFSGWGACSPEATGVVLSLVDDCRDELVRFPRAGYPGPGATLPVALCRSYFDSEGKRHPQPEEPVDLDLLRFVALHAFGHVLGLPDVGFDRGSPNLMQRALALSAYRSTTLDFIDILWQQSVYGPKPSHSLVGPAGRCFGVAGGALELAACDGSEAQHFELGPAGVVHVPSGSCLRAETLGAGASVSLAACGGNALNEAFRPDRVRWLSRAHDCVTIRTPVSGASPFTHLPCNSSWPPEQVFSFEFLGDGALRIRTQGGSCVKWPSSWDFRSLAELGACGSNDVLQVSQGRLAVAGHCLTSASEGLVFEDCIADSTQYFAISGPLQLVLNALALTSGDPPLLTAEIFSVRPTASQMFQYHF